ncbi:MAG TPA: hypothetical protein VNK26_08860, partial [Pyrinomonadaceae bacterium]|nr:hypothetical protein [Pyrinomonadaceae bacterium]
GWLPGILFLLSGGLGFYYLINDFFQSNQSFFEFLFSIPRDYTIGEDFRWGNTLTTLLITQRSLLLGLPLTLFLIISINSFREKEGEPSAASNLSKPLILGFIAGLLPLIHLHSLIVLFIVSLFNFLFYKSARRRLLFFGAATAVFALAELFWASAGSASDAEKFIAFAPGWDSQGNNLIWFWLKNTGLLIPLTILGFFLRYSSYDKDNKPEIKDLFFGYIPFAVIFLLSNLFKFAPWQWDNIKLLVYWLAASAAFAAYALAIIWQQPRFGKPIAAILFICLTLAGASDVWRTISSAINYRVFDAQAAAFGDAARSKLPSKSVILNAPTYNTASVLTGGLSFMRYPGHLSSHGIDYTTRESITNEIYRGGLRAKQLIQENRINYVLISPAEKSMLYVNEQFFRQFPLETEIGNYRLYKVR